MEPAPTMNSDKTGNAWDNWKTQKANSFVYQVQSGRKGLNFGLDNGLQRVSRYLYGTQRGRYYLIGADSSVGKTTLADFMYILNAWQSAKKRGVAIKIFYCSLEVSKTDKIARWVSYYIFLSTGKCMPSEFILGRVEGNLVTDDDLKLIMDAYDKVNTMMKDIIILDTGTSPTAIYESIINYHYEKEGKVIRRKPSAADVRNGVKGDVIDYIPNDPNAYTLLAIDHLGLLDPENGLDLKGTMDRMSKYGIRLKNIFKTTCVFIQQFSTDLLQSKRQHMMSMPANKRASAIIPTRLDFGDSKTLFRDAEIVIGLVKPYLFDIEEFWGISTSKVSSGGLGEYMIAQCLMKNRYGTSNKIMPLFINPIAGTSYDLPNSLDQSVMAPWYNKAKELDDIAQFYTPKI